MRQPISFFCEPFDGDGPSRPWEEPSDAAEQKEPRYFLELMASLQERQKMQKPRPRMSSSAEQDRTVSSSAVADAIA